MNDTAHATPLTDPEVAELQAEIAALLTDIATLVPFVQALTDSYQRGRGFLTYEGRQTLDRLVRDERAAGRARTDRRDNDGNVIVGLRWLHPTYVLPGSDNTKTPGNFRGIAVEADITFTIQQLIRTLSRRRAATVLPRSNVLAALDLPTDPTLDQLLGHLGHLVRLTPAASALRPLVRDLERVKESADLLVNGQDRARLGDPCPHCELMTLVRHLDTGLTICDRTVTAEHYDACVCPDPMCECKRSPISFRHTWHDNPKDKTQRSVWDLYGLINHHKEVAKLETKAQDAVTRIRALHQPFPVYGFASDCPEPVTHTHDELASGDRVCISCGVLLQACGHCTHDTDDDWTVYPCPTLRAIDGDPKN